MNIEVGKKYLHETFAGVKVVSKITTHVEDGIFMGHLVRKKDVIALKKAGVPYTEKENLRQCIAVVYDFQVVREWK